MQNIWQQYLLYWGVFCGVSTDLASVLSTSECEKALAPQGCKMLTFDIRNPDPVIKKFVACPVDKEVKECVVGKCVREDFYLSTDNDDRCSTIRLGADGRFTSK